MKKNVSAATKAAGASVFSEAAQARARAGAGAGTANGGATGGSAGVGPAAAPSPASVAGRGGGSSFSLSAVGGGAWEAWGLEVEEGKAPKRLEEEQALDAEIERLRKRRRQVRVTVFVCCTAGRTNEYMLF